MRLGTAGDVRPHRRGLVRLERTEDEQRGKVDRLGVAQGRLEPAHGSSPDPTAPGSRASDASGV